MRMRDRLEIRLEGITGYSTAKVFEDKGVWVQLGGNGSATSPQMVASIDLKSYGVYIVGGPDFYDEVVACRDTEKKWDGIKLFTLGFRHMMDHFEKEPRAFTDMMARVHQDAFEDGVLHAQQKMREALGIVPPTPHSCRFDEEGLA